MTDDLPTAKPYAAHVCRECGHEILRSGMDTYALVSGVVECPSCGHPAPLNIEIRALDEKKPPVKSDGKA